MENEIDNPLKFWPKPDLHQISRQLHRSKNCYIFGFNFLGKCFGSFPSADIDLGKVTSVL